MNKKVAFVVLSAAWLVGLMASFDAESRLIRSGGRAKLQDSNSHDFVLVDSSFVLPSGRLSADLMAGDSINSDGINSGDQKASAVPIDCYQTFFDQQDLDASIMYGLFTPGDCSYEFYLGSDPLLEFEGYVSLLFADASAVDVLWTLTSNTQPTRVFNGTQRPGNENVLDLMMPMPSDLLPGSYSVSMSITYWAGTGRSFFASYDTHNDLVNCDQNGNDCYYDGFGIALDSITFSSDIHSVNIFSGNAPTQVSEPRFVVLSSLAALMLFGRRFTRL